MEAHDPFATAVAEGEDPFAGSAIEDIAAEQEPEGLGDLPQPEPEAAGEQPISEPPSAEAPPVQVDREGNVVDAADPTPAAEPASTAPPSSGADAIPTAPAESAGPTDAYVAPDAAEQAVEPTDPTAGSSEPSPVAEPATEPAPVPAAEPTPAQTAPQPPQTAPAATEGTNAPSDEPPAPAAGETAAAPRPTRRRRSAAKAAKEGDGPRNYRALYQTGPRQWTELALNTDAASEIKENIVKEKDEHGEEQLWIQANNVDQARRFAYVASGRPRDGIRIVLVAQKSWQPKLIKPKLVPAREALEIS